MCVFTPALTHTYARTHAEEAEDAAASEKPKSLIDAVLSKVSSGAVEPVIPETVRVSRGGPRVNREKPPDLDKQKVR